MTTPQLFWRPRGLRALLACAVLLVMSSEASALMIVRNFTGGAAPGNTAGGGNLVDIFNSAADWWEMAILDTHVVTIDFSWAPLATLLGVHSLQAQGGVPNRETAATIRFDNDESSVWFMDSTPHGDSEYMTFTESFADLGGGLVNTGRVFTDPIGDAVGRTDLLSVAKHEIGHSLGLSAANTSYQAETGPDDDIDVTGPLPLAGTVILTTNDLNPGGFNAHLEINTALMFPSIGAGTRRIMSAVDILANAQISQFTNVNLDPLHHVIPEPGTLTLFGIGVVGMLGYGRRRRKRAA